RPGRRAAGLEAVGEDVIRLEVVFLRAVFGAYVDVQATVCRRQLDAVLAQVTGRRPIQDVFRGSCLVAGGYGHIGQCRGSHPAFLPDVPRDAGRVSAAQCGCTDRCPGRHAGHATRRRIRYDIERIIDLLHAEEVALDVPELRDAELRIGVIRPDVVNIAPDAEQLADRIRGVVVLASAALDVAPTEIHVELGGGRIGVYRQAEGPLILVESRGVAADGGKLLRRQQGVIAARHEGREGERAARAVLRLVGIARVHGLRVEVRVLACLVVQEPAR